MADILDFPTSDVQGYAKIERIFNDAYKDETKELRDKIKRIVVSTLKDHENLFLDNDSDSVQERLGILLAEIIAIKIKILMEGY